MNQQEIIAAIRQRNEQGLDELLLHCGPLIRYVIAPILPIPQDQEECVSEVAMRVWDKIETYDPGRGSWNRWLTALARNAALNRAKQNGAPTQDIPPDLPSPAPTPEDALLQRERQAALENAVAQLPKKDRVLFYRKYYYLQSTAQIAAELNMTQRAVEGRLYRIRQRLRTRLGGERYD